MAVQLIGLNYVGDNDNNGIDTTALANVGVVGLDGNDLIRSSNPSGSNVFEGNAGADFMEFSIAAGGNSAAGGVMYGGAGNDTLSGSTRGDALYGGEGDDLIIGNWQTNDADADRLYGGAGRDALYGNGGDDVIFGGDGNDSGEISTASADTAFDNLIDLKSAAGLYGGDGNDYLDGGSGNDALFGGNGKDVMTGGSRADKFVFDTAVGPTNVDRIRDFSSSEGDKIVLASTIFDKIGASLDKKEFVLGKKAKDKNDYIIVNQKKGTIAYDADGKGGAKAVVFATVEKGLKLTHTDFDIAT